MGSETMPTTVIYFQGDRKQIKLPSQFNRKKHGRTFEKNLVKFLHDGNVKVWPTWLNVLLGVEHTKYIDTY